MAPADRFAIRFTKNIFQRTIIVKGVFALAWSGAEWVSIDRETGLPFAVQVCNFEDEQQARAYVASHPILATTK